MSIAFEPNLSSAARETGRLRVRIGGVSYRPVASSAHDFWIEGYTTPACIDDALPATFEVRINGSSELIETHLRLLSVERERAQFAMHDVPNTLRLAILQATNPPDLHPLPEPPAVASPVTPEKARSFSRRSLAYIVASLAVLATLLFFVYRHFSMISVPDAMVVANYVPVAASEPAQFARLAVQVGQKVKPGDVLFETDGGAVLPAVKSAEASLNTMTSERDSLLGQIEEEKARLELYADITNLRIELQKSKGGGFPAGAG